MPRTKVRLVLGPDGLAKWKTVQILFINSWPWTGLQCPGCGIVASGRARREVAAQHICKQPSQRAVR